MHHAAICIDFSGRTSTAGLTPRSPFSLDFFHMVSECVTQQSEFFRKDEHFWANSLIPIFSLLFPHGFRMRHAAISGFFRKDIYFRANISITIFS
jgi:hypothetical protein